jgi:two-component system sensor histidine kinase/response regulator
MSWIEPGDRALPAEAEASEELAPLPEIEGVDVIGAVTRVGGNVATYRRLLAKFVANQADAMTRLTAALEAGNRDEATRVAHTLKGLGGTIGAEDLKRAAAPLEAALKGEDPVPPELVASATRALNQLVPAIRAAIASVDQTAPASPGVSTIAELRPRLEKLMTLLSEYDMEAEDLLTEIASSASGPRLKAALVEIERQLGQYDFDAAAEALARTLADLAEDDKDHKDEQGQTQ